MSTLPTSVSEATKRRNPGLYGRQVPPCDDPVDLESKLHRNIIEWCDAQWPKWKYSHSRMDKKSGIGKGIADFIVFGPFPLCVVVECKAREEKRKPEQLTFALEMSMLGWEVRIARNMAEFHQAVDRQRGRLADSA